MTPFLKAVEAAGPLIADGAMGTMLLAMGLKAGECPEAVNLTRPEIPEEIARRYLAAGAEIIQTNTFGASPLKLEMFGLGGRAEEINLAAAQAVRDVVGEQAYVAASCGPSGKLLKPYGDTEAEAVFESFRRQLAALIAASVDVICIETMTDLAEATLAIRAAKEVNAAIPVMATMTFDPTPRGFYTMMGVSVEKAAAGLEQAGADIIGSNCGNGIDNMVEIAREFKRVSKLPLLIQSNAGLPELRNGVAVYTETPEFMAQRAEELVRLEVSIIGGCCGTTPEHIRALRETVSAARR